MRTNNRFRLCTSRHKHVKDLLVCTVPIDSQILYFRFSFVLVSRILLNRHCSRMHYDTCSVLIGSVKISVPLLLDVLYVYGLVHITVVRPSVCLPYPPFHCVCVARALSCRVHQFNFLPQNYLSYQYDHLFIILSSSKDLCCYLFLPLKTHIIISFSLLLHSFKHS